MATNMSANALLIGLCRAIMIDGLESARGHATVSSAKQDANDWSWGNPSSITLPLLESEMVYLSDKAVTAMTRSERRKSEDIAMLLSDVLLVKKQLLEKSIDQILFERICGLASGLGLDTCPYRIVTRDAQLMWLAKFVMNNYPEEGLDSCKAWYEICRGSPK